MATFEFFQDHKKTIWYRQRFALQAETYEEAKSQALRIAQNEEYVENDDWDILYDTMDSISPEDNGFYATRELYSDDDDFKPLWNNGERDNEK